MWDSQQQYVMVPDTLLFMEAIVMGHKLGCTSGIYHSGEN